MDSRNLSDYAVKLDATSKDRYIKKISIIGDIDPFQIPAASLSEDLLPPIEVADLVSYFVLSTSFYTAEQFKAHKSPSAYNQFVSGWVSSVKGYSASDTHIVILGKVRWSVGAMNNVLLI